MKLRDDVRSAITIQDYAEKPEIDGVQIIPLKRLNEDGGSFTELARLVEGISTYFPDIKVAQINYSEMEPGVIKAFHIHEKQTDVWYVPPSDKILLILIDLREDSPTKNLNMRFILGDGNSRLVVIPPGVAHGCKNISSKVARIIYFMDKHFSKDPQKCDEGRLPWDFIGTDIWEIKKG